MKLRYPLALLLIVCFLAVSESDFNEEVMAEQRYVERVCAGVHSDHLKLGVTCAEVPRSLSTDR